MAFFFNLGSLDYICLYYPVLSLLRIQTPFVSIPASGFFIFVLCENGSEEDKKTI